MSSKSVSIKTITKRICIIRGQKVMIDRDLAELYGVETKYLNRQVNRNRLRFPKEFMFRLTKKERDELVPNCHRFTKLKHSSSMPTVFTEHGVAMLSSVLNSAKAIAVNIAIIQAFVKLREVLSLHKELGVKLKELERQVEGNSEAIRAIFQAIRRLMKEEQKPKKKIGFHA